MRLIDADLLLERIRRNDDLPWNLDKVMQTAFESCVRHSPTGYDVDKVAEDLKECAKAADENWEYEVRDAFYYAAEIVKEGGIE